MIKNTADDKKKQGKLNANIGDYLDRCKSVLTDKHSKHAQSVGKEAFREQEDLHQPLKFQRRTSARHLVGNWRHAVD